jgi:ubiquinone/menaquinone biosynthesis C-methylase UbiE
MEIIGNKKNILEREENYHDLWADSINIDEIIVDELFEASTSPENRIIIAKLGNIKGKKILELGCGAGEASVYFAKKGAEVTAVDISNGMLKVVQKLAKKHNVIVSTIQSSSDNIDLEDETFDIVYAANMLHHVDILKTLKEVSRVLRKKGVLASWDPIAHNPIINIYRRMATDVRTKDEHPIKMEQLNLFSKYFSSIETETTWLFTLWIFIKFYFIERVHPNEERYWKKILKEHRKLENIYYRLEKLDKFILNVLPFLKRYCWNIVVIAKK